jgi:hypothetical protein
VVKHCHGDDGELKLLMAGAYRPMIELLRYLGANGFAVYIASGGDRDVMRSIAAALYGVPPERVIGSSYGLAWQDDTLVYKKGSSSSTMGRRSRCGSGAGSGGDPEFDYTAGAEHALAEDFTVVSVKRDWATLFSP